MNYYIEITLLPDADVEAYFLWEKVYQQLHLAFVEIADEDSRINVGVSFPRYRCDENKRWLGDKLRLFAESRQALENLQLSKWLARLDDYTHVKDIKDVPDKVDGYAFFKRLNDKSNLEKLARRRVKRMDVSFEDALAYFQMDESRARSEKEVERCPFISMTSLSSGNKFPVTVVLEETDSLVFGGGFSTYGLSIDRLASKRDKASPRQDSSVPIFK